MNEELVEIDYYDKINRRKIKVKVSKEIADYLKQGKKNYEKEKKKIKESTITFEEAYSENPNYLIDEKAGLNYDCERVLKLDVSKKEQQRTLVENALCCLSSKQREVVELVFYKNMSYQEIADYLNVKKGSVYDTMQGAIKKLRKYIKNNLN